MRVLATLCLFLFAALPATAQTDEPACTAQTAVTMSFHEAFWADDPGRCVRITGLIAWRSLFGSLKGYYERARPHAEPDVETGEIGVYAVGDVDYQKLWTLRSRAEVIGRLTTCAQLRRNSVAASGIHTNADGTETFIMVGMAGTCQYADVPALLVTSYRLLPGPARLSGATSDALYADLVRREPGADDRERAAGWLAAHYGAQAVVYFAPKPWAAALARDATYACVCVRGTCDGEWPISIGDVGPQGDPPYRCATIRKREIEESF